MPDRSGWQRGCVFGALNILGVTKPAAADFDRVEAVYQAHKRELAPLVGKRALPERLAELARFEAIALDYARELAAWRRVDLADGVCPGKGGGGGMFFSSRSGPMHGIDVSEARATSKGITIAVREDQAAWAEWSAYVECQRLVAAGKMEPVADAAPAEPPKLQHAPKPDASFTWARLGALHRADMARRAPAAEPAQLDLFAVAA